MTSEREVCSDGVDVGRSASRSGVPDGRPSTQRTRISAGVVVKYM